MRKVVFKNIHLENFKCHKSLDFSFEGNKFLVVTGKNGAGKTSIFDALCWGIYDETTKGLKGDKVVRKKSKGNTCVILDFLIDNDIYKIENYRKHKKFGDSKILIKNGKDISGSSRNETNRIIKESLFSSIDIFINSILFSQYTERSFTKLKHGEQKDILDSLLGLDYYDIYKDKISKSLSSSEETLSKLQQAKEKNISIISSEREIFNSRLKNLERSESLKKEQLDSLNLKIKQIEKDIEEIKDPSEDLDNFIELLGEEERSYTELNLNLKSLLTDEENEKKREISDISKAKELIKSNSDNELKIKILKLREVENSIKSKLESIQSELSLKYSQIELDLSSKIQESKDEVNNKIKEDQSELDKISSRIKSLVEIYSNLDAQIKKVNVELEQFSKSLDKEEKECPTCGNPLLTKKDIEKVSNKHIDLKDKASSLQNDMSKVKEEGKSLRLKEEEYKGKIIDLKSEIEKITKVFKEKEECQKAEVYKSYKEEISKLDNNISSEIEDLEEALKNKLEKIDEKYKNLEKENIDKIKKAYDIKRTDLEKKLDKQKNKILEIKSEILKLKSIKENLNNKIASKSSDSREAKALEHQINEIVQDKLATHEEGKNRIQNLEEQNRSIEKEILEIQDKINILKFWDKGFSDIGIKSIILDECIPILNEKSATLTRMTDNLKVSFDSQHMLKSGDYRDKFSINILQTENYSENDEVSAGEERVADIIVLLCVRHLIEKMQNISTNIILFDEILDSLDKDNVEIVLNMLRELSKEYMVILITHTLDKQIEFDEYLSL